MALPDRRVPSEAELVELASSLPSGPGIVKDYVKSRKHESDAFFIEDLSNTAAMREVVKRFVERQGSDLAGGIVLRAFEDFGVTNGRAVEARVWWVRGVPVVVGPHPDQPDAVVEPGLTELTEVMAEFGCPFVTTDLAQHVDGRWRLVEVGDGQVSDFPRGIDVEPLLQALLSG